MIEVFPTLYRQDVNYCKTYAQSPRIIILKIWFFLTEAVEKPRFYADYSIYDFVYFIIRKKNNLINVIKSD
jgi:hypothetical protein